MLRRFIRPISYAQKLFLLATVPLILAVMAISLLVGNQARQLAEKEIAALERQMIDAKQAELKNYISIARTAFFNIYGRAAPDDDEAKLEVMRILAAMIYGQDGYFFVYEYDGTNLVSPRMTKFITRTSISLDAPEGTQVVAELIDIARTGGGYHSYLWEKPSSGETARMVTYVIGLQDWQWAVGTGIFIDDVMDTVAAARADTEARVQQTFVWIGAITFGALLLVFFSGLAINIHERRLADAKLKKLTQRIFDTQEEERGRVARELHDSISQILVGARYALELARRRLVKGEDAASLPLDKGINGLNSAINEVRRISRDLRPGVLDDLGLGPALKALTTEFAERTGIETRFDTVVFRNRLDQDAKIALYRVAQEALTNIERHSRANRVTIDVRGTRNGAVLRIEDDGIGLANARDGSALSEGLGMRNMQERMDQLNGSLRVISSSTGTVIEARVPLTHMLGPEEQTKESA